MKESSHGECCGASQKRCSADMTLQETCLKLQGIAHDGHALDGVYVMAEGLVRPAARVYRDGDRIVIGGCIGKCRQGEEDGKK